MTKKYEVKCIDYLNWRCAQILPVMISLLVIYVGLVLAGRFGPSDAGTAKALRIGVAVFGIVVWYAIPKLTGLWDKKRYEHTVSFTVTDESIAYEWQEEKISITRDTIKNLQIKSHRGGRGQVNPLTYCLIIITTQKKRKIYSQFLEQDIRQDFEKTDLYQVYQAIK